MRGHDAQRSCPSCLQATLAGAWECVHCGWDLRQMLQEGSLAVRCGRRLPSATVRALAFELFGVTTPQLAGRRVPTRRALSGLTPAAAAAVVRFGASRGIELRRELEDPLLGWKRTFAVALLLAALVVLGLLVFKPSLFPALWLPHEDLARRIEQWRLNGSLLPVAYAGADRVLVLALALCVCLAWFAWSWLREVGRSPFLAAARDRLPQQMRPRDWLSSIAPVLRRTRPSPHRAAVAHLLARYDDVEPHLGAQLQQPLRQLIETAALLSQAAGELEAGAGPQASERLRELEKTTRQRRERSGGGDPNLLLRQKLAAAEEGLAALAEAAPVLRDAEVALAQGEELLERLASLPARELAAPEQTQVASVEALSAAGGALLARARNLVARLDRSGVMPAPPPADAAGGVLARPLRSLDDALAEDWRDRVWRCGKLVGAVLAAAAGALYVLQASSSPPPGPMASVRQSAETNIELGARRIELLRLRLQNLHGKVVAVREAWTKEGLGAERVRRLARLEGEYLREVTEVKEYLYAMEEAGTFRLFFVAGDAMFEALAKLQSFLLAEEQTEHPVTFSTAMVVDKTAVLEANLGVLWRCLFILVKLEPPLVRTQLNECIHGARREMQPWP